MIQPDSRWLIIINLIIDLFDYLFVWNRHNFLMFIHFVS